MPELLHVALSAHLLVLAPLVALGLHRAWLTWTWWRRPAPRRPPEPEIWPTVTVQLPIHNERYVVDRRAIRVSLGGGSA